MTDREKFWGDQTEAALKTFGRGTVPREVLRAYGEVKKAAILAQQETGRFYPDDFFSCLLEMVDGMIEGDYDSQFPLPLEQGSAGTSLHMNVNEVLANGANRKYEKGGGGPFRARPLDDINRYQSTNDTFSSVCTIVAFRRMLGVEEKVIRLQELLVEKELEYSELLILGRTEMQNALPMTLGQIFGSWAGAVERDRWRLNKLKERIRNSALGGTAVGTCFFAPAEYVFAAERYLRRITDIPLARSQNLPDEIAHKDALQEAASGLRLCASNLFKISGDLLLYTSGMCGELIHPNLQYGSTIMPAKTNPVLLEYVRGLSVEVKHYTGMVDDFAANGQLQLNAYLPFILSNYIQAADRLEAALEKMNILFLPHVKPDLERIRRNLYSSSALLNTLRGLLDYGTIKRVYMVLQEKRPECLEEFIGIISAETGFEEEFLHNRFDARKLTTYSTEL